MKDKDIMDIEVYQIQSNKWQIIKEEKNIILNLLAYKLYVERRQLCLCGTEY